MLIKWTCYHRGQVFAQYNLFVSEIKHKLIRFQWTHLILFGVSHKRGNLNIIIVLFSGTTDTRTPNLDLDKSVVLES